MFNSHHLLQSHTNQYVYQNLNEIYILLKKGLLFINHVCNLMSQKFDS